MVKQYTVDDIQDIKDVANLIGVEQVWCRILFKGCENYAEFCAHPLAKNDFSKDLYERLQAGEYGEIRMGLGDYRTQPADQEQVEENVKATRNQLLLESDWTDTPAAQTRLGKELADKWAEYRQELRDITSTTGFPWDPQWPTKPQ